MGSFLRIAAALLAAASSIVEAEEPEPRRFFVQAGLCEDAQTAVIGVMQPWSWQREFAAGRLTGYWEASFGRWSSELDDRQHSTAWVTQLGVTPVLRWHPHAWGDRGFVEAGIGANLLLPVYRSGDKQFSTTFNFGDHLAVGWRFGAQHQHEVALRLQHFSNAGIRHPNPGEDFVQLRWAWRLGTRESARVSPRVTHRLAARRAPCPPRRANARVRGPFPDPAIGVRFRAGPDVDGVAAARCLVPAALLEPNRAAFGGYVRVKPESGPGAAHAT